MSDGVRERFWAWALRPLVSLLVKCVDTDEMRAQLIKDGWTPPS